MTQTFEMKTPDGVKFFLIVYDRKAYTVFRRSAPHLGGDVFPIFNAKGEKVSSQRHAGLCLLYEMLWLRYLNDLRPSEEQGAGDHPRSG